MGTIKKLLNELIFENLTKRPLDVFLFLKGFGKSCNRWNAFGPTNEQAAGRLAEKQRPERQRKNAERCGVDGRDRLSTGRNGDVSQLFG